MEICVLIKPRPLVCYLKRGLFGALYIKEGHLLPLIKKGPVPLYRGEGEHEGRVSSSVRGESVSPLYRRSSKGNIRAY